MNHTSSFIRNITSKTPKFLYQFVLVLMFSICHLNGSAHKNAGFKPKKVYKSKELIITQITQNTFVHTSYKQTDEFGNVPCNGLIVRKGTETIIFDTPLPIRLRLYLYNGYSRNCTAASRPSFPRISTTIALVAFKPLMTIIFLLMPIAKRWNTPKKTRWHCPKTVSAIPCA